MIMNKVAKARKYNSSLLKELLEEVTPLELEKTKIKMQIAARIEDSMRAKGWSKKEFSEKVGKNPSEITKWVSGTHNFTVEVLSEIAFALNIDFSALFDKQDVQLIYFNDEIQVKSFVSPQIRLTTPNVKEVNIANKNIFKTNTMKPDYTQLYYA